MSFTHLHVHSNYSYGMGSSTVEALVSAAKTAGYTSLALTDTNTMVGIVEFYTMCRDYEMAPIIGCEIDEPSEPESKAVLLCKNIAGYRRMCEIITQRQLDAGFDLSASLTHDSDGLIVMSYSVNVLNRLCGAVPDLYGELVLIPSARRRNRAVYDLASRTRLPLVITNDVYFAAPEDFEMHRILSAIKNLSTVYDLGPTVDPEQYLKPAQDMCRLSAKLSEAAHHVETIRRSCQLELTLKRHHCSRFRTEDGKAVDNSFDMLRQLAYDGLRSRYRITDKSFPFNYDVLLNRLQYELEVIGNLDFCDYFLICRDVVDYAHRRGFWHVGRGSAANSLVSFCLGLTEVDPIRYNLYFERFLNYSRGKPPDIDLDFSWRHRDEVLKYIYARYGEDHVAMMSSVHTLHARGALREVAKAFGISEKELDAFRKFIPHTNAGNLEQVRDKYPEARHVRFDGDLYRKILRIASRLEGFPNYSGIHSSGVVITEKPVTGYSALEKSANGFVKTQLDMYSGEDIGLIKFDILAVRGLGTLEDACANVQSRRNETVDLFNWPLIFNDTKARELMRTGKTIGVVHAESPFIRNAMRITRADTFELLYVILGMVRTGCVESGMMYTFIERLLEPEKRKEAHAALAEVLPETFGVMIFEEDVIKVLHFVGSLTLEEADVVRRFMAGKRVSSKTMTALKTKFFRQCRSKFPNEDEIELLWRQIGSFSGFTFCKAHSASYALMAFQGMYLKIHYPAEYMAAVLSNQGGFYSPSAYISECRRIGLSILPPDINRSGIEYTSEDGAVRIGLRFISGITSETLQRIAAEKAKRPFDSLEDFLFRASIEFEQTVTLIRIGCFDFLGSKRTVLVSKLDVLTHLHAHRINQGLFKVDLTHFEHGLRHVQDMTHEEKMIAENELLGFFVGQHPLEFFPAQVNHRTIVKAAELAKFKGRKVKVIGWFVSAKRIRTRDKRDDNGEIVQEGRYMKFITMEDMTDVFDTVIFPNVYEKVAAQTLSMGPYCIEGIVDARYNTINVTRLALIENRLAIDDSSDRLTIEKQETYASQKAVQLPDGDIELLDVVPMEYEVEMAS